MKKTPEEIAELKETLAYKTQKCPLLSEGDDWEKLARALTLPILLQYEDIVSRWCRDGDKKNPPPICKWLRGKLPTDNILALTALHADGIKY